MGTKVMTSEQLSPFPPADGGGLYNLPSSIEPYWLWFITDISLVEEMPYVECYAAINGQIYEKAVLIGKWEVLCVVNQSNMEMPGFPVGLRLVQINSRQIVRCESCKW